MQYACKIRVQQKVEIIVYALQYRSVCTRMPKPTLIVIGYPVIPTSMDGDRETTGI